MPTPVPMKRRWPLFALVPMLFVLPALQVAEGTAGPGNVWGWLGGGALGVLMTVFAIGRNTATRADVEKVNADLTSGLAAIRLEIEKAVAKTRTELLVEVNEHSPWSKAEREVMHRMDRTEERLETVAKRVHDVANVAQSAAGVLELVKVCLQEGNAIRDRVTVLEAHQEE